MPSNPTESPSEFIAYLESFFSLIDTGRLFCPEDGVHLRLMRAKLREALSSLLVWERPTLETSKGLMWPYEGFADRHGVLEELAQGKGPSFVRDEARKFLAFLPFPGQWDWMLRVSRRRGDDEVRGFLAREDAEIARKIESKPQRHYKLRHFCQVLKRGETDREKGVLRIFSLPYLFTGCGLLAQLSKRYVIFAEPPMGIVFRHLWWRHFSLLEDPCVMGVSSDEDVLYLKGQARVEPVQLAHGDFLEEMEPMAVPGREKVYDIVFNASFDDMERKRHGLMLRLLLHPLLTHARSLFLGRGSAENIERLKQQVELLGLGSRVTIFANMKRGDVPAWLGRCKMAVHLSLYENACRSIYEFFRSDVPCVISSSMGGMNLEMFEEGTGVAVRDCELAQAISFVLNHLEKYQPRRWFLAHSGSGNSSRRLNTFLRERFERWGYEWHDDIVPLASSGASRYCSVSDFERFRPEFEWILDHFRTKVPTLTFSVG